jgi:O-antigen/teichoic acid export membrane protein
LPRVGLLSLIWVVVGYFSILDFGLGPAVTKTVSEALAAGENDKVARLYRAAQRMQLVMGLAGGIIMAAFAQRLVTGVLSVPIELRPEALLSVYLCAVAFPFVLLTSSASAMLQAARRFDAINLVQAPLGIGQFVLPLVCVIWTRNLGVIVAVLLVSRIIALISLAIGVRRLVPLGSTQTSQQGGELRSLISFGSWVSISNVISPLMVYADRFLIGSLQAISSVAYYSVPSDATLRLLIVPRSLASAMFPEFSATRDNQRLKDLLLRSVRYILLLVGIPSLILFFAAHEVMSVWMGASFAMRSATVLQILLPGIVANSIAQIPFSVIQATGRPDLTAKLHLSEFLPYVLVLYFATKGWGIEGAAFAWSLRVIVDTTVLFYLARRRLGISLTDFVGHRIPQLTATLTALAVLSFGFHAMAGRLSQQWVAAIFLTVVLISMGWGVFVTAGERARVLETVSPRFARRTV